MSAQPPSLSHLLSDLTGRARALGLKDVEWAALAGIRQETLSRLRRRQSCDLSTLRALAEVVGAEITLIDLWAGGVSEDGHLPLSLSREDEARLLRLACATNIDVDAWLNAGPRFFVAGVAVMLAGEPGCDRQRFLALAEQLHPGASLPEVFSLWLERSPLRPSRFLPMLAMEGRHGS